MNWQHKKNGTEKRVEGVWGRGDSSPPIKRKRAAQPLLKIGSSAVYFLWGISEIATDVI
jgi:hypothetical protein